MVSLGVGATPEERLAAIAQLTSNALDAVRGAQKREDIFAMFEVLLNDCTLVQWIAEGGEHNEYFKTALESALARTHKDA